MALPYVTEDQVKKIFKQLMTDNQSKPESKNKYPVLNYTLEEIKQYVGVPYEELPIDFINNIEEYAVPWLESSRIGYVEFQTKDNYTFKGVLAIVGDISYEDVLKFNDFACYDGDEVTRIVYRIEWDSETGDCRPLIFNIEVY